MKATREVSVAELATVKNALIRATGRLCCVDFMMDRGHTDGCYAKRSFEILDKHLNPPEDLKPQLVASLDATGRVDVRVK